MKRLFKFETRDQLSDFVNRVTEEGFAVDFDMVSMTAKIKCNSDFEHCIVDAFYEMAVHG